MTVKNALAWTGLGAGSVAAIQLLSTAVIARSLTPADYGLFGMAMVVVGFATAIGQAGLAQALVYQREEGEDHIAAALAVALVWGGLWAVFLVASAPFLESRLRVPQLEFTLRALSCAVLLRAVAGVFEGRLLRLFQYRALAAIEAISYFVGYGVVGVVVALSSGGVTTLVTAFLTTNILRTTFLAFWAGFPTGTVGRRSSFQKVLSFGTGQTIAQTANFVATESDNLIVGALLGPTALGVYGRAYQLAVAPANLVSSLVDRVLYPALVRTNQAGTPLGPLFARAGQICVFVVAPLASIISVLAPEIVLLWLGPQWRQVVVPLRVLALGLMLRALFQLCDCFCRAAGVIYGSGLRQAIYAAAVISGATIGSRFGVPGVACGVLLAMGLKWAVMTQLSVRALDLRWREYIWQLGKSGVLSVSIAVSAGYAAHVARLSGAPVMVTCAATVTVALGLPGLLLALNARGLGSAGLWPMLLRRSQTSEANS